MARTWEDQPVPWELWTLPWGQVESTGAEAITELNGSTRRVHALSGSSTVVHSLNGSVKTVHEMDGSIA